MVREMQTKLFCYLAARGNTVLFIVGVLLLGGGLAELSQAQGGGPSGSFSPAAFDPQLIQHAVGNLFKLVEGAFGVGTGIGRGVDVATAVVDSHVLVIHNDQTDGAGRKISDGW